MNAADAAPPRFVAFRAGLLYFALVFAAGFALGPVRILWAVPRFGTRLAELMEMPIMIVVIVLAARWVVGRLRVPFHPGSRLAMGCIALALLVAAELALVLPLRGLSLADYPSGRDPVSGAAYYLSLGILALVPLLVRRH